MRNNKITNLELTSLTPIKRVIAGMGLEEKIIKLKATHTTNQVVDILNRDHPKPTGAKWWKDDIVYFLKGRRERCKDIAATNTSVCDKVSQTVEDTANGVQKLNRLLNKWLDNIDENQYVKCEECGSDVKVFDTDKASRLCAEVRRTLMAAHKLSGDLPNVEQTSETVGKAVEFTQMLDKMVHDGTIILVSKDLPISKQVAKALGETIEKPKEKELQLSIDKDYDERTDD